MKEVEIFAVSEIKRFRVHTVTEADAAVSSKINNFDQAINTFLTASASLVDGIPVTMLTLERTLRRSRRVFFDFIKPFEVKEPEEDKDEAMRFTIPRSKQFEMRRLEEAIRRSEHAFKVISESFLVALVTQFDNFVGELVRAVLLERAEILNSSDRVLTFSDLQSFASLDDARRFLIDKEVDQLLRQSHKEYVDWFGKRLRKGKEVLTDKLGPWNYFIEVVERRNIIVHNDGLVSKQYLEECRKVGFDKQLPSLGSALNVTQHYYIHAYETVVEVGIRLGFTLWLNGVPDAETSVLDRLQSIAVDQMTENRDVLANKLMLFAKPLCKDRTGGALEKTMTINLAQSYKWIGDQVAMEKVLSESDFSASDDAFRLAIAVLKGDAGDVERWMRRLALIGDFNPNWYREWPLFRDLRKDESFVKLFEELYSEQLSGSFTAPSEAQSRIHEAEVPILSGQSEAKLGEKIVTTAELPAR